jgi:DNA invertase Pin-like site-specific DNA recombinase
VEVLSELLEDAKRGAYDVLIVAHFDRLSRRRPPSGRFVLAGGLAALSLVRPDGSFLIDLLPASLVAATGMAFAFIPSLQTAVWGRQSRRRRPAG